MKLMNYLKPSCFTVDYCTWYDMMYNLLSDTIFLGCMLHTLFKTQFTIDVDTVNTIELKKLEYIITIHNTKSVTKKRKKILMIKYVLNN